MSQFLDFPNFYQLPAIPIGTQDKNELDEMYPSLDKDGHKFKRWLVALLWYEDVLSAGWKVIVFPVSESKAFWSSPAIFHTASPSTFDNAWKLSKAIELACLKDLLTKKFTHPYWDDWTEVDEISKEVEACST